MSDDSHDAIESETPEITSQSELSSPAPSPAIIHDFDPKSIVLAKVKGYPSWPAMVLDESYLPENILAKKPKSQARVKANLVVPIRFFSDDTYIWIKLADIKHLSTAEIDRALDKFNNYSRKLTRKDRILQDAFGLAKNPPDLVSFVRWGSQGEPEGYEEEEEVEPVPEPVKKKQKTASKAKPAAKSKAKAKAKPKTKAKPAPKPKVEEEEDAEYESEPEDDSDWGLDETDVYDYDRGNYIFDDEKEQINFNNNFPLAIELTEEYNAHQQNFDKINVTLSSLLLEPELNVKEIEQNLTKLTTILKTLPKTILLKSFLYRVLVLVLHKPIEHFPNRQIRDKISKILMDYLGIEVKAISLQDLEVKVEAEEINGTEVSEITVQ